MGSVATSNPHEEELPDEHMFIPPTWMDSRGLVLEFRADQAKVVKQFLIPTDMTFLRELPDTRLHQAL